MRKGKVTKEHIEQGKKGDANCCPLALSLQSFLGNKTIAVRRCYADYSDSDGHYGEYGLSSKVLAWVSFFDRSRKVEPFEYQFRNGYIEMMEEEIQ